MVPSAVPTCSWLLPLQKLRPESGEVIVLAARPELLAGRPVECVEHGGCAARAGLRAAAGAARGRLPPARQREDHAVDDDRAGRRGDVARRPSRLQRRLAALARSPSSRRCAPFVTAPFGAPPAKSAAGRPSTGASSHVVPTCAGAGPAPGAAGSASCHTASPSGAKAAPLATSGRDAWSGVE